MNLLISQDKSSLLASLRDFKGESQERRIINPWEKIFQHGIPEDLNLPKEDFQKVVRMLQHNNVSTVLDVAMGSGRHSLVLAKSGFLVQGFDLSPTAVKLCQMLFKKNRLPGKFINSDMFEKYPYDDNTFDAVIAVQAIYHGYRKDMQKAIDEVGRVLKPGGLFYFNTSRDKIRPLMGATHIKIKQLDDNTFMPLSGREKGLVHFYPTEAILDDMLKHSFSNILISHDTIGRYFQVTCRKRER